MNPFKKSLISKPRTLAHGKGPAVAPEDTHASVDSIPRYRELLLQRDVSKRSVEESNTKLCTEYTSFEARNSTAKADYALLRKRFQDKEQEELALQEIAGTQARELEAAVGELRRVMGDEAYERWESSRGATAKSRPTAPAALLEVSKPILKDYISVSRPSMQPLRNGTINAVAGPSKLHGGSGHKDTIPEASEIGSGRSRVEWNLLQL
ncbi:hypothetical protein C8R46DRAFT_1209723 [Mycena filopes]|nr:hypothetical protein C8R46DRAFT_1209723 [Mycena filopes]